MNWDYNLARQAERQLKRFPKHDQHRVFLVLEEMKFNPFRGDVRLMQGEENLWRRRTGNYRIYFRPQKELHILDIPLIEHKQSR